MSSKRGKSHDGSTVTTTHSSDNSVSSDSRNSEGGILTGSGYNSFPSGATFDDFVFTETNNHLRDSILNESMESSHRRGRDSRSRSRSRSKINDKNNNRNGRSLSVDRQNMRGGSIPRHPKRNMSRLDTSVDSRTGGNQNRRRRRSRSNVSRAHSDATSDSSVMQILGNAAGVSPTSMQQVIDAFEPNVHENSICAEEINGPSVQEMKENEIFARKAGINFSQNQGGDYLTFNEKPYDPDASFNGFSIDAISPRGSIESGGSRHMFDFQKTDHFVTLEDENFNPDASVTGNQKKNFFGKKMNMIENDSDFAQLRYFAKQLSIGKGEQVLAPVLARLLRDFQFAQEKRRKKFGNEKPWGILGLYDHLAAVRMDVEWAEDAVRRRSNQEPYHSWVEFNEKRHSGYNRPFFTYLILVICTVFLVISVGVNNWSVELLSTNPMIGPSAETLVTMGAKDTLLISKDREIWRLFSPMVLHAGLIHFCLNMFALWFVGSAVEQSHGFVPAFILFVVPAVGGTVLSGIFLPEYISVGASGGIFGLIGACLADITMNWRLLFSSFVNPGSNQQRHAIVLLFLFLDIVINCLIGLTPFVDNFTHLGGMIIGFLCGFSTMNTVSSGFFGVEKKSCLLTTKKVFFRTIGMVISFVGISAAIVVLLEMDVMKTPCKACKALSCVPFPPWESYDNKWWYCDDCGSVTADASTNAITGEYKEIFIHCPGSSTVSLSLGNDTSTEKVWLESNLPRFCRQACPRD